MISKIANLYLIQSLVYVGMLKVLRYCFKAATVALLCTSALAIEAPAPAVNSVLKAHQAQWVPARIEHVAGPVHMAIGYDLSNMVFVEGRESTIVIDWGGFEESTARALADYRQISDKPVKALILTHPHGDHFAGVGGLFPNGIPDDVAVIGPQTDLNKAARNQVLEPYYVGTQYRGAALQMGFMLPEGKEGTVGAGVGPVLRPGSATGLPPFTHTLGGSESISIEGVNFDLVYAPADVEAHYAVWLPDYQVLITGDLPSIRFFVTPRQEPTRDIDNMINSNRMLAKYPAQYTVYLHSPRIYRGEAGKQMLLDAHDYLKLIRDQTYRAINNNQSPDELIVDFPMPTRFLNNPEMMDHYHPFSWMLRGLYTKKVGWFGGEMTQIVKPLGREESLRMAKLAGGEKLMWEAAKQAYEEEDFGWAIQLAAHLIRLQPDNAAYRQLKAYAQRSIAYRSHSASERHFLLTDALALEGKIDPTDKHLIYSLFEKYLVSLPIAILLDTYLGPRLRAEECLDTQKSISVEITDRDELHTIRIRNGVALYEAGASQDTVASVRLNAAEMYDIFLGQISWREAIEQRLAMLRGDANDFYSFVDLFEW